jgi:hypothetical protein
MANKRRSLAELLKQDEVDVVNPAPVLEAVAPPKPKAKAAAAVIKPQVVEAQPVIQNEEKRFPKSDFIKMSVTVPPEMFEQLQDLSRSRRRAKEPYTMSDLVRDALAGWLPEQD